MDLRIRVGDTVTDSNSIWRILINDAEIRFLDTYELPRDFTPERIHVDSSEFYVEDSDRILKFSGSFETGTHTVEILNQPKEFGSWLKFAKEGLILKTGFLGVLGVSKCLNGFIILRRIDTESFTFEIFDKIGEIRQEIDLNDLFAADYLQEISPAESHIAPVEITEENMNLLARFLNTELSLRQIGQEIYLFSLENTLNVLQRNEEYDWDASMIKSFPDEIKSLWYSPYFQAIFMITSLGILQVNHLASEILQEDTLFFGQQYLNVPKLVRYNKLIGITWTHLYILTITKENTFSISSQKIPLPGVVDAAYYAQWGLYVTVTENKMLYTFPEREISSQEEKIPDRWRRNREKFKEHLSTLMKGCLKMNQDAKHIENILNFLGFIRNFFIVNHEVVLTASFRQTLGTNVEVSISLSDEINQVEFPGEIHWCLCVFNTVWMQKFNLETNITSFDFMLPEHLLLESPVRVEISAEFSVDGENFLTSFPLRVSFNVSGTNASSKPLLIYYSKMNALQNNQIDDFAKNLCETNLSSLGFNLHQMTSEETQPSLNVLKDIYTQLRSENKNDFE
ncbi:hypothetical protein DMENIID0001_042580 [Sergentomyia squamirostris]